MQQLMRNELVRELGAYYIFLIRIKLMCIYYLNRINSYSGIKKCIKRFNTN